MRKFILILAGVAVLGAPVYVWGVWVYEGKWGREGRGDGEFI
jgi:hypothetical protein